MNRLLVLPMGLLMACSGGEGAGGARDASSTDQTPPRYITDFRTIETPISDSGKWVNGGTDGKDWTDVSTRSHRAIGHQVGASYTDATAILTGTWNADQSASAVVFATEQLDDVCKSEVELRLRSGIEPHRNWGYEVAFKVSETKQAYVMIVRWNGVLGDFKILYERYGPQYGVKDGDVVRATAIGNTITAYKNGVVVGEASDGTYPIGHPGIGFNLENGHAGCPGTNDEYGFSKFSATDGLGQ